MAPAPERLGGEAGAAQEQAPEGSGEHHEREGDREKVQGDEGEDGEAHEQVVVESALGDAQDRLHDYGYHDGLDPVQKTRDRRNIGVGHGQVGEEPQDEDRRYDEKGAGHDPAQRAVQPPPDVGSDLLGLGPGQEHAEVEGPQVLPLRDPPPPLHQLAVHDRDLARRPPEVYEPELYPKPEGLPKTYSLGASLPRLHPISTFLVNNTA